MSNRPGSDAELPELAGGSSLDYRTSGEVSPAVPVKTALAVLLGTILVMILLYELINWRSGA